MRYFLLLVFVSLPIQGFGNNAEPAEIRLDSQFQHVELLDQMRYVRVESSLQLSEVQTNTQWTQTASVEPLLEGLSLWAHFKVSSGLNLPEDFAIVIGNPTVDIIDVYVLDDKNRIINSYQVGADRDKVKRPINHRKFVLPLEVFPFQDLNLYIRIVDDGPLVLSLDLWRQKNFNENQQLQQGFIGVIGGALLIMACYFLITYVMLRSPIRFWFAVSSSSLLLLFLNIQGIVSQVFGLGYFISNISTLMIALLVLAAAKVAHLMLIRVPIYWRFVSYVLAILLLVSALIFNEYWQIIATVSLAGAALFLQLLLAILFHNRDNSMPNRIYAMGWMLICSTAFVDVMFYLTGISLSSYLELVLAFLIMSGVVLIAVAIEAHEQVIVTTHQKEQQLAIANLRQFYDLFRNSAEGLYTSTVEGELITTNPAMCTLFGYDNEQQMLNSIANTSQFYAKEADRELLLGELYENGMVLGKEIKGVRRDGSEFWFSISCQIREENDNRFMFGSIFDISDKKQSSISLEYLATHDSLTGVYNRREFELRLRSTLKTAQEHGSALTLLYMDLDQFKVVNDSCGHKAGDDLIKQLSQQLNDKVLNKGMLARLGGDEFGVLLEGEHANHAQKIAQQLLEVVQDFRFTWENRIFSLGISIGLVPWESNIHSPEQLLSMADSACYMAKEQGRNQVHVYSQEDKHMQRYESELSWVGQINKALENNHFELYYQHYHPLSKVAPGHHYEILLRMCDEQGKVIPPGAFFPAAERYNLTAQIDKWVVENTFKWLADQPEHKEDLSRCNINLSGHSLADNDLKLFVLNAFEKYTVPYDKICFEITESLAIVKMEETLAFINTFHKLGCSFALDDFGSGFSSYSYLKNLPVNYVKIDGSFVKDLLVDPIDMAMVSSIKDIATAMGMETVAEFVESKEIMVELGKIGVDYAQGYGIAKPAPLKEFAAYHQSADKKDL